ncbi:MAG: PilZ domain-containing protein [Gammaproteobacteria bacterium]
MEPLPNTDTNADRRYYNRTDIGCHVTYKLFNEEKYKDAVLVNISETGALLGVSEELNIDTHLYLIVESTDEYEQPIQMLAETIRTADSIEGYAYCYGCMILDVFY